ncbi:ABC transporter ATP-binding protein [Halobellus sp. MBLA0160]|uniref:ABC transporter ATP-binding protein n=1 Tax=Halobellus ruber TaxID=2761102 RepID=A0A7J9SF45_9EURY|nr:ABC transporter ATP-binding protein [Halobellus ruber]MBB6645584.1 ABC transporter ATP-binding protein [Halobellus ruber]
MLRVDGVTAGYGATTVLQDVSVDVGNGEVVGLVGRNGVGKTTTLRTVMGTLAPRSGSVTYDGEDVGDLGPEETVRRGIALVPEERRIFGGLSVRENLELAELGGTGGRGGDHSWGIDEVLDTFENLADNESAPGSTLSGGEQQMLAVGRALVSGGRTLLLDEPTEGLAPYVVERVVETIESLRKRGLTVLLVEQNVRMALDVCDYVYVMDSGRIVHRSSPDALRDDDALDRHVGVSLDDDR